MFQGQGQKNARQIVYPAVPASPPGRILDTFLGPATPDLVILTRSASPP